LNGSSFAQTKKGLGSSSIHELAMDRWTSDDGLITNKIVDIKQSYDGYIWLTTYDGILRFDGIDFEVFNTENTLALTQNTHYQILETADSTLWFVSRGQGLLTYKNGEFSKYNPKNEIPTSLRSVFFDSNESFWAASYDSLYRQKSQTLEKISFEGITFTSILCMAQDDAGNMYFGTDGNGIIKYENGKINVFTKADGLVSDVIISITKGFNNDIIAGTFWGAFIIRGKEVLKIPFTEGARINDIYIDEDQNMFFGTDLGLYRINEREGIYEKLLEGEKLSTREVNTIAMDHEGNLWLGMEKGGLILLKVGKLTSLTSYNGLSISRTNVIQERTPSEFWIGSDNGHIDIFDTKTNSVRPLKFKSDIANRGVRDILFDKEDVWVASYKGLLKITKNEEINYTESDGLSSRLIRRIIKDQEGNLLVATRSGGLNKISPNGKIEIFDKTRGLKSNYILSMLETKEGLHVGTNRGGISIIHDDGEIENIDDYGEHIVDVVNFNIRLDHKDRLWVATSNGLFLMQNKKLRHITFDSSVNTRAFFDVLDDGIGNFWMSTSKGLIQLLEKDLTDFIDNKTSIVKHVLYGNKDGLPSSECTAATRMLLDSENKLWIPTNNGVGILDYENMRLNNMAPQTYITKLVVDNTTYNTNSTSSINISPGHVRYTIGFTALSFVAPREVQFLYQLEGIDQNWNTADGTQREIQYTNLPAGTHTFRVKAANNDGIWNEEEAKLIFTVEPFIYQTLWFYLVLILLFIIGFILIYKWRVNEITHRNVELKKLNNELDSFVYSTSHDLRAPLASMLGLLNLAKMENDPNQKNEYMKLMESSVKKLDNFISDIINYSRNSRLQVEDKKFNIKELVEEVFMDLKYSDADDKITKSININGSAEVKSDSRRIKIILNNLISNALKYNDVNKEICLLDITIAHDLENLSIVVEDNGIGIEPNQIDKIFKMFYRATESSKGSGIGLYIVKETVTKLRGTVSIDSILGKGAKFEVMIPIA